MNKYIEASILLGSYLDTVGFNNGIYEFNFNKKINNFEDAISVNYQIILDFFFNGGFKDFKLKGRNASDDTILMLATGKVILKKNPNFDDYKKEYLKSLNLLEGNIDRVPGIRTIKSLKNLKKINDKKIIFAFQDNAGGNGAAMRSAVIGIKFRNNLDELIKQSILSARITHPHPYGYLGSFVVALFTKYAIEKIHPSEWFRMLLSDNFENILEKIKNIINYSETEFNFIENFFIICEKFYLFIKNLDENNFSINILKEILKIEPKMNNNMNLGFTGIGVILVAYYSLIISLKRINFNKKNSDLNLNDYEPNWQILLILSSLNFGDSDTIGIIAGNWYGALFGYKNVITDDLKNLEFYSELKKLSQDLTKSS